MFAVWDDDAALDRFLARSPVARRWAALAQERYVVRLAPVRGTARGVSATRWPVRCPSTSATVRWRSSPGAAIQTRCAPAFYRAIAEPAADLPRQPGVLAAGRPRHRFATQPAAAIMTLANWPHPSGLARHRSSRARTTERADRTEKI